MNTFKTIIMHWAAAGIFACLLAQAPIATAMNFPPGWTPDVNNPNDIFSADACNRTQQSGVNVIYATLPGNGVNDPCLCAMTVPNPANGTVDIVINPNACGTDHICAVLGEEAMHATQLKDTMAACAAKFPNSLSDQEACVVCTTDAHTIVFEAHAACYGVASGAGQPASDTNPNSQACSDTENTQPQLCGKWCDYIAENPPGTTAPDPSLECASGSVINSSDTPNLDFHVDNADSMCDWAPTPTPTPSGSGTPTPTPTPTPSSSSSSTPTPTPTPTATPSNSGASTPTPTPTPTYSGSASPTPTATPTITYSYSPSPS